VVSFTNILLVIAEIVWLVLKYIHLNSRCDKIYPFFAFHQKKFSAASLRQIFMENVP